MSGPEDVDGEELPWPRPEPDAPRAQPAVSEEREAEAVEGGEQSRTQRRAAHAARVRRRRRIVAAVGGALLVVLLAFTLWYELESHALGPQGPQVVVTVRQGESFDAVISALSQAHVIGSTLAFQISDVFHGTPTVLPGSYALHENQTFAEVRAILAGGPNIYPVDVRPGFALAEVAAQVDGIPGHAQGGFAAAASSGAVHSVFSPPVPTTSRGCSGPGRTSCSRARPTSRSCGTWCSASTTMPRSRG